MSRREVSVPSPLEDFGEFLTPKLNPRRILVFSLWDKCPTSTKQKRGNIGRSEAKVSKIVRLLD
jgi:hypothetical protein